MDDDRFKELIIEYLNVIYVELRLANRTIGYEDYRLCSEKGAEAILTLLSGKET